MMKNHNPGIKKMMKFSQKWTNKKIISSNTMKILMMAAYKIFIFNHTEFNILKVKSSFDCNKIIRMLPGYIEV